MWNDIKCRGATSLFMAFEDKYEHQSVILALRFILQIYPVYILIILCCSSKNNCSLFVHTNKDQLEM